MLKDLKLAIKVIPYYVAGVYLLYMGFCLFPFFEELFLKTDLLVYTGPTYAIPFVILSVKAGFCNWHRFTIVLPLIGVLTGYADSYIAKFSVGMEYANVLTLAALSILAIYSGIKVLWRKR